MHSPPPVITYWAGHFRRTLSKIRLLSVAHFGQDYSMNDEDKLVYGFLLGAILTGVLLLLF